MGEIREKVIEEGKRNAASRYFFAKSNKDMIVGWREELNRILQIFNVRPVDSVRRSLTAFCQTELAINTHTLVADIHRSVMAGAVGGHPLVGTASCLLTTDY